MRLVKVCTYVVVILLSSISAARAEEMKYRPVNPNFGGHPLNGGNLMNSATAQRQYGAPVRKKNPAEEFARSIQASILSRVSREIADAIMGDDAKNSGSFSVGETEVDFERVDGQVVVTIKDPRTGGSTVIEMPDPEL